jgi:hypothetical protein
MESLTVELYRRLAHAFGPLGLAVNAAIVAGVALFTAAIGVAVVVSIPPDHFKSVQPESDSWRHRHPVLRWSMLVIRNALGLLLLALGIVMAVPLVPGPGLVFILLGVSLLDFPGKHRVERRLIRVPIVIRFLNDVRARFGRPPLVLDRPDDAREKGGTSPEEKQ